MKKRTFTKEEKLNIIKEASEKGITETLEKYGVYKASYYDWKKKLEEMGEEGFQHGMTPQENGHIESFHAILSRKLNRYTFWSINDLEQCLVLFYEKYNNHRLHSSIAYLPPMVFWDCWEKQQIETKIDMKQRKIKHKLKIPYHELSGKMSLRAVPCSQPKTLDGFEGEKINEMSGAESLLQPSV